MNESMTAISNRPAPRGQVPPERLARCNALVIGVGALGRQVALQLAALGIARMTLFDDEVVKSEDLAPQGGYWPEDFQRLKARATADLCRRIHPQIHLTSIPERFKRSTPRDLMIHPEPVVFCCVDRCVTRRMLWDSVRSVAQFFVDGRMSAEVLRVIAVDQPAIDDYYPTTLCAAEQAYDGPGTAPSTIYASSIAAGLMVQQFAKWLRGLLVDPDLIWNLLASELTARE